MLQSEGFSVIFIKIKFLRIIALNYKTKETTK